jgi:predicted RNase H-like nuclease (RuvC/YqgF family)
MHKTVGNLKAENQTLDATVKKQKKTIEALSKEWDRSQHECDVWKRATGSFEQEKNTLQQTLKMIEDEFALNSKPTEYLYASRSNSVLTEEFSLTRDSIHMFNRTTSLKNIAKARLLEIRVIHKLRPLSTLTIITRISG